MFDETFLIFNNFKFLTKLSIFDKIFDVSHNFRFLCKFLLKWLKFSNNLSVKDIFLIFDSYSSWFGESSYLTLGLSFHFGG